MRQSCLAAMVAVALVAAGAAPVDPPSGLAQGSQIDPAKEKRLEWFRDAKYGMFIHWGLYAIPAGEWRGRRCLGLGEWLMNRCQVPVRDYEQLAKQFNPTQYDPDAWVQLAQDAGMKYIVITSKHHDGFALFNSAASPYNVVDATPYKKDILAQLAQACARHGMRLGFYYSQSQDWHEPGGAGNSWDFGPDTAPDGTTELKKYDDYLRGKAEPQVKELLTGYGPVALIWFDTPRMMTPDRGQRFATIVRSLQPNTLIDGRLGTEGDYRSTGDNVIPSEASTEAWETPATTNDTWGFRADDTNWKGPGQILFKLIDIVSKGGNYLLNVGPRADGTVPEIPQENLRTVGRWLKVNGEAVYGAHQSPFGEEFGEWTSTNARDLRGQRLFLANTEWRATVKPGKLYLTFFVPPRGPFELPAMQNQVTRAYRLMDRAPVTVRSENGRTRLTLDTPLPDPMATVVVVEFTGDRIVR